MSWPPSVCTWTVRTCPCAGTFNIEFTHYLLTAEQAQCIRQARSETRLTQCSNLVETPTAQGPPCDENTFGIHANWPDCKHNSALGLHGCVHHPRQRVVDGTADAKLPLAKIQQAAHTPYSAISDGPSAMWIDYSSKQGTTTKRAGENAAGRTVPPVGRV
jgi:hypothetical protein